MSRFIVHNLAINDLYDVESNVALRTSTIEHRGDVHNMRDFNFLRPKVDTASISHAFCTVSGLYGKTSRS